MTLQDTVHAAIDRTEPRLAPTPASCAVDELPSGQWLTLGQARRWGPVLAMSAALALDRPMLTVLALVAALVLTADPVPRDVAIPLAVGVLLAVAVTIGLLAQATSANALARPGPVMAALLGLSLLPAWTRRPRGQRQAPRRASTGWNGRLPYVPAFGLLVLGVWQAFDERLAASWVLLGTDAANHMTMVHVLQETGRLDYSSNSYPQGLHALAAWTGVPGQGLDGVSDALGYDIRLVASATILSWALLCATSTCLVLRFGALLRLAPGWAAAAALATGLMVAGMSSFTRGFVMQAAAPSLLAATALLGLPLTVLVVKDQRRRAQVCIGMAALATFVLANLWQALAVAPVLGLGIAALTSRSLWRSAAERRRPPRLRRRTLIAGALVSACAAVAAWPVVALLKSTGVATAGIVGTAPAPPMAALALAAAGAAGLLWQARHAVARLIIGQALALVCVCGAMLVVNDAGFDLTQYYPQKVLWFLLLLLIPSGTLALAVVGRSVTGAVSRSLGRLGPAAGVARATALSLVGAFTIAFLAPPLFVATPAVAALVAPGPQAERAWRRLDIAREHGQLHGPVAVPVALGDTARPDLVATGIVSKLLSFQTGQPVNIGFPADVCDDVRHVAAARDAVIVTALRVDYLKRLMAARGCADVRVIRVPGGTTDEFFLPKA